MGGLIPWIFFSEAYGKLDWRALSLPAQDEPGVITEETFTPLPAQVASIWAEMLHQPHVNLHDDFFSLEGLSEDEIEIMLSVEE